MALSKPSSPDPVYTPGTARGAKLASLLVDEGTALVRNILEQEVQKMKPPSLRDQLKKHRKYLCGLRFLNPGQRNTLYPRGSVVPDSAEGFDISLLELPLKELCRKAPYAGPRDRLRQFRNRHYGHTPSTDLSEADFERLWEELTDILVDLGEDKDKISDRLSETIDPEQETIHLNLLQRLYREENEVKDILLATAQAQEESQTKRHEELKSLLGQRNDNQRPGPGPEQSADGSYHTGSSDMAEDVITCLKDLYGTEYAHVRPLPWCEDLQLHLEEVYTSLQLQVKDNRGRFEDTDTIVSLADIYNTSEGNGYKDKAIRKVRVEGPPGIGKSCSCQKLAAYDWSSGKLGMFKAVFFLEMRHLTGKVKDAIFEQLLPKDAQMTPDQLWSYIQENQEDVLFILDGLDELSQTARENTDVVDLIQGKILRNCHVLVTSRPYHCVKDLEKCHQFYKIKGYSRQHSIEFIRKYFCKSPESASRLEKQLFRNSNLLEIVVNPLNSVLICLVWEDSNEKLPSSKAELYEMIVYSVAKRFCTKTGIPIEGNKLPPDIKEALRCLGKLSWEELEQDQLQFNIDEITKKYDTSADNMLNVGLLTRDYSFSRIKRTCYCAFLHKTFQEYMAAYYISELVMDEGSRTEGMKCLRSLFGMTKATAIDKESMLASRRKYREVQNALTSILGENAGPLFDMFAEGLIKAGQTADRECLSFLCIMFLGKTRAGGKMAEIVVPYLPQHITNNLGDLGDFSMSYEDFTDWIVGLTHVLTCQKKLAVGESNPKFVKNLTINWDHIRAVASQEKLDVLENTLSDYDKLCSVTLRWFGCNSREGSPTFSPLRTFIPKCGTERLSIHMESCNLSFLSSLKDLSEAGMVKHVRIVAHMVGTNFCKHDVDISEYDRLLARMITRQSRLRSLRLTIQQEPFEGPERMGYAYGNLTATLQNISEHPSLEVVEIKLPRADILEITADSTFEVVGYLDDVEIKRYNNHETFDVEPTVHKLTECIDKNKLLKTLRLRWSNKNDVCTSKYYYGVCSAQSLSNLCSAIRRNRTLETLKIHGMLSRTTHRAKIVAKLMRKKPSNYKQLRITLVNKPVQDTVIIEKPERDQVQDLVMEGGKGFKVNPGRTKIAFF